MQNASAQAPKYHTVMTGGLALFSLSLALSKSAANISIALLYLAAFFLSHGIAMSGAPSSRAQSSLFCSLLFSTSWLR